MIVCDKLEINRAKIVQSNENDLKINVSDVVRKENEKKWERKRKRRRKIIKWLIFKKTRRLEKKAREEKYIENWIFNFATKGNMANVKAQCQPMDDFEQKKNSNSLVEHREYSVQSLFY